jgi:hypothetical protein|tara:strand:+ start:392 stop:793 length:402 start_codon:yes stop_codon:yes gene_type:complete
MTIDKAVYQPNRTDEKILKIASKDDPLQNIELDTIATLKQEYDDAVRKGYQGSFSQWISETDISNLISLKKGGAVRRRFNDGGLGLKFSRDTLIGMLKNEYPKTYIRYMDDLDKMSDAKLKDILNKLDIGMAF